MQISGHPILTQTDIRALLELCCEASRRIVQCYNDESSASLFSSKEDRTPLTQADLASHQILSRGLAALRPELPLLSEECSSSEIAARHQWGSFWMVDPLDGTREFLERTGEFTINIALIEAHRPTLGVIYEPLRHRARLGIVGAGAWELEREDDRWRSTAITTRRLPSGELVLLASKRHRNARLDKCLAYLEPNYTITRQNSGSALKFCDLATGQGDCYPRFSPCSEWDVAAGDALVSAAGGALYGIDGAPLRYNARDSLLSPHFVAVGDRSAPVWSGLLECVQ